VTIDRSQFERWPPVWVADNLLELAGTVGDGSLEDNARNGIATTDSDDADATAPGDIPITASGIIDTKGVSRPPELHTLQQVSLRQTEKTINVVNSYWQPNHERKRYSLLFHLSISHSIPLGGVP
jgi:hypothetical protein